VFITLAMMIAIMQPYKSQFSVYNAVDSVLVLLVALWCTTAVCINTARLKAQRWLKFWMVLSFILTVLPLIYLSFVTLHWMCCQKKFVRKMIEKMSHWIGRSTRQITTFDSEESLPDRLINPTEYEEDLTAPVAIQVEDNSAEGNNVK